jgi:hypothetical protein
MSNDIDEVPPVEPVFGLIVFWAVASVATVTAYDYGVGYLYFELLGLALWTSAVLLAYHYREEILEELRERWEAAQEPADPDDVIDDVVDDGEGSS